MVRAPMHRHGRRHERISLSARKSKRRLPVMRLTLWTASRAGSNKRASNGGSNKRSHNNDRYRYRFRCQFRYRCRCRHRHPVPASAGSSTPTSIERVQTREHPLDALICCPANRHRRRVDEHARLEACTSAQAARQRDMRPIILVVHNITPPGRQRARDVRATTRTCAC